MSALRLQTFGNLALLTGGDEPLAFPQKALLIVCMLRLGERSVMRRDEASALLWPETDRESQHINLRKLVSRVRKAQLDTDCTVLAIDETSIALGDDGKKLAVDAAIFRQADASLDAILALVRERFLGASLPSGALQRWAGQQVDSFYFCLRERILARQTSTPRADPMVLREAAFLLLERNVHDEQVHALLERHGADGTARQTPLVASAAPASFIIPTIQPASTKKVLSHPVYAEVVPRVRSPLAVTAALPRLALLPPALRHGVSRTMVGMVAALIDDITISLCTLRTVSIVAPYTAKQIQEGGDKSAMLDTHAVSYLVDTTLSADGLLVQIIFVPLDRIIWAERFPLDIPFSTHRKTITRIVADSIATQMQRTQDPLFEYELHPDAYRAYLAGARQTRDLSLPSVRGARRGFREALTYRRDFAPSFVGLARSYSLEWVLTARGDRSLLQKAEEHARIAIAQDPEGAAGFKELGVARLYLGDLDESLEALARAEALSPHYADAIYSYADSLVHASRPDEGLLKIRRAIDLNPLSPDDYLWSAAGASYFVGKFQDAVDYINRMSQQSSADRLRAASFAMLGDITMARRYRRKDREANPHFDLDRWLAVLPIRESWQKELYREGLTRAGY
jgi:tetratricopeptide (TPR) repeat protein